MEVSKENKPVCTSTHPSQGHLQVTLPEWKWNFESKFSHRSCQSELRLE